MKKYLIMILSLILVAPASAAIDCANLPTVEEFIKNRFDPADTKDMQKCLRAAGFYAGKIDGIRGPQTVAALKRYESKKAGTPNKLGVTR